MLDKAVNWINAQLLKEIVDAKSLNADDREIITIMHGLIEVAADKESDGKFTWEQSHQAFTENPYRILHNLKSFAENTSSRSIQGPSIKTLKERFIATSASTQLSEQYVDAIREFLCEGFCYIDIIDEINLLQSPDKWGRGVNRSSFPVDTSM